MSERDQKAEALLSFGEDLIVACAALYHNSNLDENERSGISSPEVLALALVLRSVNNYAAMRKLLESGFIVEARTIVRCIYENLFWLAALSKKGDEFIAGVVGHDTDSRVKRGRELLSWARKQAGTVDFEEKLEAVVEELDSNRQKTINVGYRSAADAGGLSDGYIIYRALSTDSAHPSASSLSRHLTDDPETGAVTFHGDPISDEDEHDDTLELAASALLGVCVSANDLLRDASTEAQLELLVGRWLALQRPASSPA